MNSVVRPEKLLVQLMLGAILGVMGQMIRVVIGLKKHGDRSAAAQMSRSARGSPQSPSAGEVQKSQGSPDSFLIDSGRIDGNRLLRGFLIGALAGGLLAIGMDPVWGREQILMFLATGYAGTDFIEGFIKRYLPQG